MLIHEVTARVPTIMSNGRGPMRGIGAKVSKVANLSMPAQARNFAERGCWPARRAVDLEALGAVFPAASACLLDGVGEEAEHRRLLATRLGGTRGGRSVQHALEDGRVAGSIRAEAKVAGEIDGADSPDRLDAMVTRSSGKRVAARSADAEHADAVLDRVAPGHRASGVSYPGSFTRQRRTDERRKRSRGGQFGRCGRTGTHCS